MSVESLVELALHGERFSTRPSRHGGGECDAWQALPTRAKRRIIGLGWAGPSGCEPDVLADWAGARLGHDWQPCDLVAFLAKCAPIVVRERRRAAHARRHLNIAQRHHGAGATYYVRRTVLALDAGHLSVHAMCKAKGWR